MRCMLAERLKDVTFELRKVEKEHFMKVQEIHGKDGDGNADTNASIMEDEENTGQEQMFGEQQNTHKSKEIQDIAKSITDLAVLFKDLSTLVVEQGTILDRIDYNIHEAKESTTKANVSLEKTLKIEKSGCSRNCIIVLGGVICLLLIVLMFKWH